MRQILNLSIPQNMVSIVKDRAKKHGFESVSEYIRFLLNLDTDLISPQELLAISKRADREYRTGKIKKINSLAELL